MAGKQLANTVRINYVTVTLCIAIQPVQLAAYRGFDRIDQYSQQYTGNMVCCYAELVVSCRTVAKTVASTQRLYVVALGGW